MQSDNLIDAAKAVLAQWDTPNWKLTEPTAKLMADLRKAVDEASLSSAEPVAARYDFDGCGFQYIDNGSGSDWKTRQPDAEMLYDRPQQPTPSVAVSALYQAASDFMHLFIQDGHLTVQGVEDTDLIPAYEKLSSALSARVQDDYEQNGYCKVIDVEKLLCEKLGRKWSATGISIVSLVNELATQMLDVTGWERITVETRRKSGTSHADVWPDGEGWEIDTDRGRVNTPDAGWDRFSNHEELYFRRRANDLPAAPAKQEGGHD